MGLNEESLSVSDERSLTLDLFVKGRELVPIAVDGPDAQARGAQTGYVRRELGRAGLPRRSGVDEATVEVVVVG